MKLFIYLIVSLICLSTFIYPQQIDSLIQILPGTEIGDTIDLFDREFFNLYPNVEGFQEASLYVRDNDKLVSRMKLKISNVIIDSVNIYSLAVLRQQRLNLTKLEAENDKKSEIKPDAVISLKDGRSINGQVIMFSKSDLYFYSEGNIANEISPTDALKIPALKINEVNILGQNKTWSHAGWGALWGVGIGGIIGFVTGDDESGFLQFTKEEKALLVGSLFGLVGGIIGLISGISSSTDDNIIHFNSNLNLLKLKDYSKYNFRYDENINKDYKELE